MHHKLQKLHQTVVSMDKKYLTAGLLSMSTSNVSSIAIAIATSYFFANYLEKTVFGNYQFVLTIIGLLSIFTLRGVGKQITKECVRTGRMILIPKTLQFISYAIPVAGMGLLVSAYFYYVKNPDLAISIAIASVSFPFLRALPLYNTILVAKRKFWKLTLLSTLQIAIPAVCLITIILQSAQLVALVTTYCLAHITTLTILYGYTIKSERVSLWETSSRSLTEIHLSLGQSILELGKIADKFIVFSLLGTTAFASYMIGLLPARELFGLPQMLRTLVVPKFSQYSFEQVRATVFYKTFLLFIILSLISLLSILLAPLLYTVLFPAYPESILYFQLIALSLPFSSYLIFDQMLTVFDRTNELYVSNMIFSTSVIILLSILTIQFGILGTVVAKVIANIIRFTILAYFTIRS